MQHPFQSPLVGETVENQGDLIHCPYLRILRVIWNESATGEKETDSLCKYLPRYMYITVRPISLCKSANVSVLMNILYTCRLVYLIRGEYT